MTRGHPPAVAIAEAKKNVAAQGSIVIIVISDQKLPFDFVTWEGSIVTLVRVRRLRYAGYGTEDIAITCVREIAELRNIPVTDQIYRELHVRGPDRHWHRYLVLPATIEILEDIVDDDPDKFIR